MASFALLSFWVTLALAFLAMSILSYRMRTIMPTKLEEAMKGADFAGADVKKLEPVFNHLLWLEFGAFLLTSVAAFVEFLTLAGLF